MVRHGEVFRPAFRAEPPWNDGDMAEIVLIRHGATEWSTSGRHTGVTDVHLTERGERQAGQMRTFLAGRTFAQVLVSPRERARRTAELIGLTPLTVDADLAEWDYGGYEGRTTPEIRAEADPHWSVWRHGVIPGATPGETVAEVGARSAAVIARALPVLDRGDVALVAHGHFLRILAATWVGLPPRDGAHLRLDTASISVLGFEREERVIRLWNVTPDLLDGGL
jgi:probable phosphoglycerate mutase